MVLLIFQELSENCGYVILPSSSEGIATAVLTAMGRGSMIPVVTKECGMILIESVKKAIELISHDELIIKAYTLKNYQTTMRKNLQNILTKVNNG